MRLHRYCGLGALIIIGTGGHCDGDHNLGPDTFIERDFPNDGTVNYIVRGKDIDGRVKALHLNYNTKGWEIFSTDAPAVSRDYRVNVEQSNILEAYAVDNKGKRDRTPARDDFLVPNREGAFSIVKAVLDARTDMHLGYNADPQEKIVLELIDEDMVNLVYVDFIINLPNEKYAVINYIGLEDDIEKALKDEKIIQKDPQGNSLYLYHLPLEEILKRTDAFVQGDFLR